MALGAVDDGLGAGVPGDFLEGEGMAKQLGHRADGSLRQAVKVPVGGKQAVSDEHVEMGVEDEVIAKSMNGGDGADFAYGKIELEAKGFGQGIDCALEQKRKQLATFAKDTAQHFGNGENHLSMRDLMTYRSRDPVAGGSHAALVAGGAEVASFAGEGEQPLMAAIGAFEARESGGKIAAAEEGFDGGDGGRFERAEYRAVCFFVTSDKGTPAMIDKLPER